MMSNSEKTTLLILVDSLILLVALLLSMLPIKEASIIPEYLVGFLRIMPLWLIMYFTEGLYTLKTHNPAELPISLIRATTFAGLISFVIMYFAPGELRHIFPGTRILIIVLVSPYLMFEWRQFFFKFLSTGTRIRNTLLIGSQETIDTCVFEIDRKPYLGYKIVGTHSNSESEFIIPKDLNLIAIERSVVKDEALFKKVFSMLGTGVEIMDLAHFSEKISGKIPITSIDQTWFIEFCGLQKSATFDLLKTFLDRTVATALILLLLPLMIFLIPLLLIVHGRPIFFKQTRVGLNNKNFTLYKLRTMVVDAEKAGAQWAKPGDARVTFVGAILRKTRLDELPQLINIFKGEMSLVGPRPERPEIIKSQLEPNIPYFSLRHLVKPGVTGWAQVTFRYGFTIEDSKEKLQFDLFYVKNRSLWLDVLIIAKTIKTVITGAGQ
ncbi:MAG: exopolysaccharide biosynthesis polyprenyl glycosylphosphotransferase [Bacteriovoracaceae bacterium]|nr:exopolysaccharide biosynthesis polyprenyl glycosylphosphotransferase [Bacteriovoracaceae bacterium]